MSRGSSTSPAERGKPTHLSDPLRSNALAHATRWTCLADVSPFSDTVLLEVRSMAARWLFLLALPFVSMPGSASAAKLTSVSYEVTGGTFSGLHSTGPIVSGTVVFSPLVPTSTPFLRYEPGTWTSHSTDLPVRFKGPSPGPRACSPPPTESPSIRPARSRQLDLPVRMGTRYRKGRCSFSHSRARASRTSSEGAFPAALPAPIAGRRSPTGSRSTTSNARSFQNPPLLHSWVWAWSSLGWREESDSRDRVGLWPCHSQS